MITIPVRTLSSIPRPGWVMYSTSAAWEADMKVYANQCQEITDWCSENFGKSLLNYNYKWIGGRWCWTMAVAPPQHPLAMKLGYERVYKFAYSQDATAFLLRWS